ncbi:MFS transporter [Swaminathania salitolerans]|uniref:MFS transporter n=1 Tax=Swaminathania salitolerans TaxID=182838 RepID=A0A511BMH5_9PROT|nr:MFS transporter [Swaminathania salitolerans]GBQ15959.1 ribitol transporter [Swaminathania salitolerans LMG 21291]GEL01551.1 MFS transporter [Swaminathania salitolerans]
MSERDKSKVVAGMPVELFWGYIAVAIFMTGDGIEIAFLSKYLTGIGFSPGQAAELFTVYGLTAAVSSWLSGALAETFHPRKLMAFGTVWWIAFHALFLTFGLAHRDSLLMNVFYGIRGIAYPLFYYGFYYWIVQRTPPARLASALGWVWSMFVLGYGTLSSFIPSLTIPAIGFLPTLWTSILWVAAGGILAVLTMKDTRNTAPYGGHGPRTHLREIAKSITLITTDRNMFFALVIRVTCNLSLFGFPVIMPLFYTSKEGGFTMQQWLHIYSLLFAVQLFTNIAWGIIGDRIGWMRQIRWAGFVGCGVTTLTFYYLPLWMPGNMAIGILAAVLFAITITAFVPMGAIFPTLAPEHKGAAVSVQNLGGGLGNFTPPAIATALIGVWGIEGVVICYSVLYFASAILTVFIKLDQPGHTRQSRATVVEQKIAA